jgi:hypothetical protein
MADQEIPPATRANPSRAVYLLFAAIILALVALGVSVMSNNPLLRTPIT